MGICAGCLRERGVFGERDAVSIRAGSGIPARILTAGDWLYKKEKKHLLGGEDAAKVWLGVKRIERWFLLNNRGVTGKIKSGEL